MQAAHDAAEIPLLMRDGLDRFVSIFYAGVVKGVDVDAADDNHPEKIKPQRPQIIEGIEVVTENFIQCAFKPQQHPVRNSFGVFGSSQSEVRLR